MDAALTTQAALLQMLREGPAYGGGLIRRARRHAPLVEARPGTVYPALKGLVRKGYVKAWPVVPGRRRGGRARNYYELTARGMKAAERQKRALSRLVAPMPARVDVELMARRIRKAAELSALTLYLRDALRRRRR
jgi:DNA-binding PadR family transcriptional regulator